MYLYEAHLTVSNTEAAKAFYTEIVGLRFGHRDPKRDIVFLWVGESRISMLGLWGPGTVFGSPFHKSHLAIAVPFSELLRTGERLNRMGVITHNSEHTETNEPSVIGWMPSAQLYFQDPDGHSLEFISLLDDPPDPDFIGPLSEWRQRPRTPKSAGRNLSG